jgi:YVTN family beta-propeller protein
MSLFGLPVRSVRRVRDVEEHRSRLKARGARIARHRAGSAALYASLLALLAGAGVAIAESLTTGRIGPSLGITANGRVLHPIGRQTVVGVFPTGSALTPDGRFLWVTDCGHASDDVRVMEVASGAVVQTLPLPGCYGGIAFAPDGLHAYVSGNPKGSSPTEGPTQGDQGDVIHVFSVEPATGKGVEQTPLVIPETAGGDGRVNSLPPIQGVGTAYPEGLAVSPDGKMLVVALNAADSADVVNLATNEQSIVAVGHYPSGVAFDHAGRAYVSNEYDGTLSVIDTATHNVTTTISGLGGALGDLAAHPEGMVADPVREQLYVAVTNRDLVAVVNTATESVSRLISVRRSQGIGTEPVKLAVTPDGKTLFAADANEDALAAISLAGTAKTQSGAYTLIGRLPTAAYPDDVQVTPDGSQLIWIAGKGYGSGPIGPTAGSYVLDMLLGRVGVLPLPSYQQIEKETSIANKQVTPYDNESQPAGSPIPAAGQGPSQQIKHVFYIVRENRTYDQVFGSDPRGDGEKSYELFGDNGESGPSGGITPNAHALARSFPLLDHYYMDSEVSVDGHLITTGGIATDYAQKATAANYSGRRGTYDFGIYPITFPPKFFVFDQAAAQGISFKDFGEQAAGMSPNGDAPNRPEFAKVEAGLDQSYPNNLFIGCAQAGNEASCTQDSGIYNGTGKIIAGQSRFDEWYPHFQEEGAKRTVPTFTYMILPNDHTDGTTLKDYTPQAMVADNDLALGQIVDAISHSSIWGSTAIFVQEDDSQDGFDHVDSHRSPALIISPWARRGVVVHARHDQYSMLRTAELITGIDPLSLNDALATPFYDAFISGTEKPDVTPYNVIAPTQDIAATNTSATPASALSTALPWSHIDAVPQEIEDRILWEAVHGAKAPVPPPGPNASPIEQRRAAIARGMIARGENVSAWLTSSPDPNDPEG